MGGMKEEEREGGRKAWDKTPLGGADALRKFYTVPHVMETYSNTPSLKFNAQGTHILSLYKSRGKH